MQHPREDRFCVVGFGLRYVVPSKEGPRVSDSSPQLLAKPGTLRTPCVRPNGRAAELCAHHHPSPPSIAPIANAEASDGSPKRREGRGHGLGGATLGGWGAEPSGGAPLGAGLPAFPGPLASAGRGGARGGLGRSAGRSPGCGGRVRAVLPLPRGSDPARALPRTLTGTRTHTDQRCAGGSSRGPGLSDHGGQGGRRQRHRAPR